MTLFESGATWGWRRQSKYQGRSVIVLAAAEQLPDGLRRGVGRKKAEIFCDAKVPACPSGWTQPTTPAVELRNFRQRADDHRVARDGFCISIRQRRPARDVVLATVDTLERGGYQLTPSSWEI